MSVVDLTSAFDQNASEGGLPDHFSQSQLGVFVQCPERYRVEYIQGRKGSGSSALRIGSGVHKGVETYYALRDERITSQEREQRAVIAAGDYVDDQYEGAEEADEVMTLVHTYIREAPKVEPVALEERIEIDLPDCTVPLVGWVDCVATDRLLEIKTSKTKVNKPSGAWKIQAFLYQAAHGLPMDWHVIVKSKKEPYVLHGPQLRVTYDKTTTQKALAFAASARKRIEHLYETRGPDEEWPLDGVLHPWACSMCAAKTTCIYGETAE